MVLAFGARGLTFKSCPYISAMHLFICFFVTDFVRKMWARPGLAEEPFIPFNVKKMDFLPNRLSVNNKMMRGDVLLQETTPSSMAAS